MKQSNKAIHEAVRHRMWAEIEAYCSAKGMSVTQFIVDLGDEVPGSWFMKKTQGSSFTLAQVFKACTALGVSIDWMFGRAGSVKKYAPKNSVGA